MHKQFEKHLTPTLMNTFGSDSFEVFLSLNSEQLYDAVLNEEIDLEQAIQFAIEQLGYNPEMEYTV